MFSDSQLIELKKCIKRVTHDLGAFKNDLGVREEDLHNFFFEYIDYLQMLQEEDLDNGINEPLKSYNTDANFCAFYHSVADSRESDPLPISDPDIDDDLDI